MTPECVDYICGSLQLLAHPIQTHREMNRIRPKKNSYKSNNVTASYAPQQQKQFGSFFSGKLKLVSAFSMFFLDHSHQFDYNDSTDIQSLPEYPPENLLGLDM